MAELVAYEGKSLGQILKELEKKIGEFHTARINVPIDPAKKEELIKKLGGSISQIGKSRVVQFVTTDGFKFLLPDREWVAFRASGTEPLFRCYVEARSASRLKQLQKACRQLLGA
jgi:phosphoglucomutase